MTSHVHHTNQFGLAGQKVPHAVAEPEAFRVNVVHGQDNVALLMLTFTTNGVETAYAIDESQVAGLQSIFNQALPIVMAHNKPKGPAS